MYLNKLNRKDMHKYAYAVEKLPRDEEFQDRFAHDPILDELDQQKIDYELEADMARAAMGLQLDWKGVKFNHLTPWRILLLWTKQNALLCDPSKTEMKDLDYFFWLLNVSKEDSQNEIASTHYCVLHYKDIISDLGNIVKKLLKIAFYPLTFIPRIQHTEVQQQPAYDFDWMIHTCCDNGMSIREAIDMPLCVLTSLFVQKLKGNQNMHIGRTPPEEIMEQQALRTCELIADRLVEKNVLEPEKRDDFVKFISAKDADLQ